MRKTLLITTAFIALASTASGQLNQINAMTVPNVELDWDLLAPGATDLNAINAQFGAGLTGITLTQPSQALGLYTTNIRGNALGGDPAFQGAPPPLWIVDDVNGEPFAAFGSAIFELGLASTEFGFSLGDWNGNVNVEVRSGGGSVGDGQFNAAGGPDIFFDAGGASFDTVEITLFAIGGQPVVSTAGNWVLPSGFVQIPEPATLGLLSLGALALIRRR